MQFTQRILLSAILISFFACAEDIEEIFDKPVISRVTEEKIAESQQQLEARFERAVTVQYFLTYGVLPVAAVCTIYAMKDKIANFGGTLMGTVKWVWSGFSSTEVAKGTVNPEELSIENLAKIYARLLRLEKLHNGILDHVGSWCITFTSVLLSVLGKEYAVTQLSSIVGTQDLSYFIAGSTSISQMRDDLKRRQKRLRNPLGRTTIEHMRERISELGEKVQIDVVRIIAFMQALNKYNDFEIGSLPIQARMLIDEANDMASLLEYKIDEFDHTADLEKRQELLKEMVQKIINLIALIDAELDSFGILVGQPRAQQGGVSLF